MLGRSNRLRVGNAAPGPENSTSNRMMQKRLNQDCLNDLQGDPSNSQISLNESRISRGNRYQGYVEDGMDNCNYSVASTVKEGSRGYHEPYKMNGGQTAYALEQRLEAIDKTKQEIEQEESVIMTNIKKVQMESSDSDN